MAAQKGQIPPHVKRKEFTDSPYARGQYLD